MAWVPDTFRNFAVEVSALDHVSGLELLVGFEPSVADLNARARSATRVRCVSAPGARPMIGPDDDPRPYCGTTHGVWTMPASAKVQAWSCSVCTTEWVFTTTHPQPYLDRLTAPIGGEPAL